MSAVPDILSWVFLIAGGFFTLVGGVGVLRMPDLYTRLHASGVTDTLGVGFVLVGLMFQAGASLALIKLFLLLLFFGVTSPTGAHALAKCALHGKLRPVLDPKAESGSTDGEEDPSTP